MNEGLVLSILRCPDCRSPLTSAGKGSAACSQCGRVIASIDGVLDLVPREKNVAEEAFYEEVYATEQGGHPSDVEAEWRSRYYPVNEEVRRRVGNAGGKKIVLLGNGTSAKELQFLEDGPTLLVYSDLSLSAPRAVRDRYFPHGRADLIFAAIDGEHLPFADESVDLVYGYAFVHHLPDVDGFLGEVSRVLRPGGRAVFMDDAYSVIWQGAKRTVLRPLMRYFHRLQEPSPEDLRFTLAGGFRETVLGSRIRELDCNPWFERSGFLHYLITRASERLPPQRAWRALVGSRAVLEGLIWLDGLLARIPGMESNLIRLVWGFDKPVGR
jgi:SAM-dependent methyltransferase